ncbi:MAG: M24 family metallopeptidase [Alphaproteobacteria bacterium]
MSTELKVMSRGADAAFPREEYARRITNARREIEIRGIDALLVTGPENIFYLTGQQTPGYYSFQCLVLPVGAEPVLALRQLESWNALLNTHLREIAPYPDGSRPAQVVLELLDRMRLKGRRIGIEKGGWFVPIALYDELRAVLGEVKDGSGIVEGLRMIKSAPELEAIDKAARYCDAGMRAGLEAVREGVTDNQIVARMMAATVDAGSEYMGMEPFVPVGRHAGVPHATWRRRAVSRGDPVLLELAGVHERYHAALMRTAWVGKAPDQARRTMDACLEALDAALGAVKPGNSCETVHRACQAVIDRRGFTAGFRKRTGYSIGIAFAPDWGEGNVLSLYEGVRVELRPGMVFHVPTTIRDYESYTMGVSETVVVTRTGHRALSAIDRALVEA